MRRRIALLHVLALGLAALAAPPEPAGVLFENVRIFDGKGAELSAPSSVLVRGNRIERIAPGLLPAERKAGLRVIPGGGRTLMPGLIDAHWHAALAVPPISVSMTADPGYLTLVAGREARNTLMRGFTSVRDLSGPVFGLKRAIDEGVLEGPRIWPSGAMISQTGGHGDFRLPYEIPKTPGGALSHPEAGGMSAIADNPDEVRLRSREQFMHGAVFLKLAAGGGVSSNYDPLDASQYTEAEFRAAVEAAENWGTYVTVHAYTPRAIQTAVRGGVRCIDHGQLLDEPTARLLAEKGIWLCLQPFLDDEDAAPFPPGSDNRAKQLQMSHGTDTAYALARKYRIKTAWGTDVLFDARLAARQGFQLAKMGRWYPPAEVLAMATRVNAELLALSGPRNPYPGRLGVVEEGALADLLLVEGNPLADLKLVEDADRNFVVIMKDGRIHKDILKP
ncbi:metal-dependent hydrolase family protein [Mesoterricola silvestris]|uniref:Hydrolase n=1 Tax=Mesoterricola silvestris TaxID=2927979 RepID=A0AA48GY03_9BACT|nr:amidohydrolase family protein [Mesoterricola silvestris]BDU73951.1 hydrolase [Mesoterricola silvestris]